MNFNVKSSTFTAMLIVTIAAPAHAQQRGIILPSTSSTWSGGNHPSSANLPLAQAASASSEILGNIQPRYNVAPIGVLPGKTASFLSAVRAVNNRQHVTGYSYVYAGNLFLTGQGFLWQDGQLKALPLLGGWPAAFGFSINDRDQVVGTANNVDASGNILQTAVLWDHGQPVNLGALHPGWNSAALDINIWGVAVGVSGPVNTFDFGVATPVVWFGNTVQALPLLPGETAGTALEINAEGVIAGSQQSATNLIPCLWYWNGAGYTAVNLGGLGGDVGQAFGINNLNQVVGYSLFPGDIHGEGFLWDVQHGLKFFLPVPGDTDDGAFNINDLGQVVGQSGVFDNTGKHISQRAALWENGKVFDLQTLVPSGTLPLTYEIGNINDLGDIAVNATNPNGSPAALLLVPKRN